VGGTLHVVANNQLGFTTLPSEYTSCRYPTDIAKMLGAPIFHVNAEALDELWFVLRLALAYRQRYGKDVVIDLVGYRRRGHNETDEPSFTQPTMYAEIARRPEPWKVYAERLLAESVAISQEELQAWQEAYLERLESEFARVKAEPGPVVPPRAFRHLAGVRGGGGPPGAGGGTGVPLEALKEPPPAPGLGPRGLPGPPQAEALPGGPPGDGRGKAPPGLGRRRGPGLRLLGGGGA
jgi:2-oxoglutarate dehydrogenase E1 component